VKQKPTTITRLHRFEKEKKSQNFNRKLLSMELLKLEKHSRQKSGFTITPQTKDSKDCKKILLSTLNTLSESQPDLSLKDP
jgi:hypothetical protein